MIDAQIFPMFKVSWLDRMALKSARKELESSSETFLCFALPWYAKLTKMKVRASIKGAYTLESFLAPIRYWPDDFMDAGIAEKRIMWIDALLNQEAT